MLGGDIIVGESLAIIAGGDITTTQSGLQIIAKDLSGVGQDITIIAGANVTGSAPTNSESFAANQSTVSGNSLADVELQRGFRRWRNYQPF